MSKRSHLLRKLFMSFMKIGAFTFGGGYAMISLISETCVKRNHWITDDEMMNITVIAESTPGPVAINAATYVGYKQAGIWGAVLSTLGMILPSSVIICLIGAGLENILSFPLVTKAFSGIKIAVGFLILDAAITMVQKMPKKKFQLTMMVCSFFAMGIISLLALPVSSIQLMLLAGVTSLSIFVLSGKHKKEGGKKE